jgi:hypothetical protein
MALYLGKRMTQPTWSFLKCETAQVSTLPSFSSFLETRASEPGTFQCLEEKKNEVMLGLFLSLFTHTHKHTHSLLPNSVSLSSYLSFFFFLYLSLSRYLTSSISSLVTS